MRGLESSHCSKGRQGQEEIGGKIRHFCRLLSSYSTGVIAVMPPKDMYDGVNLWFLLMAMNGTREASRQWGLYIKDSMVPAGFIGSAAIPGLYYHPEWDIMIACHGDDWTVLMN